MGIIAIDLETKGLITKGTYPEVLCVGLATNGESDCLPWSEDAKAVIKMHIDAGQVPVFQNASFDVPILEANGIDIPIYHDIQLMSYVLEPGDPVNHSLEDIGEKYGFPKHPKPWVGSHSEECTDELMHYCKNDAVITFECFWKIIKRLEMDKAAYELYTKIELPFSRIVQEMQAVGLHFDVEKAQQLAEEVTTEVNTLIRECQELYPEAPGPVAEYKRKETGDNKPNHNYLDSYLGSDGDTHYRYSTVVPFNPNSSQQRAAALRHLYGWEPVGKVSMDADAIRELSEEHPDWELLAKFAKISKLNKILTGFLEPFAKHCDNKQIVRGSFNQCRTLTGRLSSSNPNLQNIPRRGEMGDKMRSLITGYDDIVIINGDLSNIEARVMAYYLLVTQEDDTFAKIFQEGRDFHSSNAEAWGVDRDIAKTLFFAALYGASEYKIAESLEGDVKYAKTLLQQLDERFPAIAQFKTMVIGTAREDGGCVHTLLGRRLVYPTLLAKEPRIRSRAERQIVNAVIQGSATDIIKYLMIDSYPMVREHWFKYSAQVHDEALLYGWAPYAHLLAEKLTVRWSTNTILKPIPIAANFKVGYTWKDAH